MDNDLEKNTLNQEKTDSRANVENEGPTVVRSDLDAENGQYKCTKCGSTDILLNIKTGKLKCNFCKNEIELEKVNSADTNIWKLNGTKIYPGAHDIIADSKDLITLKCESCGAEIVIDTASATQARCHWCRNYLSINKQVPNGAVPDMVLPFKVSKEEAKEAMKQFIKKRRFFANSMFIKELNLDNIMGVYLPYMVVDVNGHALLKGTGRYKDQNCNIVRDFYLEIDDLTVESKSNNLTEKDNIIINYSEPIDTKYYIKEQKISDDIKTNNIINSIMPFDTENCVRWNSNYIRGYTAEKRDLNVKQLEALVQSQANNIALMVANNMSKQYEGRYRLV